MAPPPISIVKSVYLTTILKYKVRSQINAADFIINFSGDADVKLRSIGWKKNNIINCGYYSPPLLESAFTTRESEHWSNFTILMTGRLEWHRNPMVLLKAMHILKLRGISSKAIITQEGPLLERVRQFAHKHKLNVDLRGFVSYDELLYLYQTCSCFIASGRSEPWGIRVNDALHCGAPLLVSEGMGAKKIVKDYGCGLVFSNNDPDDLANKLEYLITDKSRYLAIVNKVKQASLECLPVAMSSRIADEIKSRYNSWR
ncbi:MAG TPA: glycosyltransferase [Saprospiraceae bacterium]|nr:glycosyltransferase [Saprospiraceae bacterium]